MKVEELTQFGKALEMPEKGRKKQQKVMFSMLRKEFGIAGLIFLYRRLKKHSRRIQREYPEAILMTKKIGKDMDKQMLMMTSLFFAISDKKGKKFAQRFMTSMMQNIAPVSMPAIYQLEELVKCEGDVFENYKKFNKAMFTEIDRLGTWKNSGFRDTENLLEFKVTSCINVDFCNTVGCPEIGTLGCDHDLAGYPLIEDATQSEFRRPCAIAKGDECCHFHFYRKGFAPETSQPNK